MTNVACETDVGVERDRNEDEVLCSELDAGDFSGHLLVVADGMGGHAGGEMASRIAAKEFEGSVRTELQDGKSVREAFEPSFEKANEKVREASEENPEYSGMGTTLVAAVVSEDGEVTVGNVGDSRAYIADDSIEQITEDQSLVQELLEEGVISEEEAEDHPQKNVISQAIGTDEEVEPDFYDEDLEGRSLLLCSDGLSDEVSDKEILDVISSSDSIEDAADRLIDEAKSNGGKDNISVALAEGEDTEDEEGFSIFGFGS
jgi:serine/threonine protein phosphatase PrpC